jgi:hypothetical protein
MTNYLRHNWYHIGGILFAALSFFYIFGGDSLSRIQTILLASFMAMLIHQCEEYSWPGGFPSMSNIVMCREKQAPDRYPFNANQCWISNTFLTYAFYIIPIFLPKMIWLGLAQVMLGMLQIIAHGIMMNIRLKSIYNPGLGAAVFLQWPIGIYYIHYVAVRDLAGAGTYALGLIGAIAGACILFLIPIAVMRTRNTKYPFYENEMYGFAEKKIRSML